MYFTLANIRSPIFILAAASVLSACSGGSGGGASPASAPVQAATTFQSVVPAANFNWSTAQSVRPKITLSNSSGSALGPASLFISAYSCVDMNDGSALNNPLGFEQFANYTLSVAEQALADLSIDLSALSLQLPATQKYVLVELVSGSQTLYSQLLTPTELVQLQITLTGNSDAPPALCKP